MRVILFITILFLTTISFGQEHFNFKKSTFDVNQFHGSILLHNPDIAHLITAHPAGIILSYNKKTFGEKEWQSAYNYPDVGYSFIYQDMNNKTLGEHFGVYMHYNFYYFKRKLQFRVGQGIVYNTNPYDKEKNFRNIAYGSHIMSSTYFMLNFHKENIFKGLGVKTGLTFIHYSNGNYKAPNTSTNTLALNLGLIYNLNSDEKEEYVLNKDKVDFREPFKYNIAFRTGLNNSDVIGSGRYAFYILSAYTDKRLGRKSAIQIGSDVFFSNFLKELIYHRSIAFNEADISADTDYKRVGVFLGHELFINKLSVTTQLGYYVYYPYDFEGRIYNRLGLKRYFGRKLFGEISLKSHAAKAEAIEFGIGIRL